MIGFRFEGGALATLGFAAIAIWFTLVLSALTSAIGLRSDNPETVSSNLYLPYLPLLTLSTAFAVHYQYERHDGRSPAFGRHAEMIPRRPRSCTWRWPLTWCAD